MDTRTHFSGDFYALYEDDPAFLEKTATDYPASQFSYFLLLQQYKKTNNPAFETLAKKAGLYFHNPAWIQYQLSHEPQSVSAQPVASAVLEQPVVENEPVIDQEETPAEESSTSPLEDASIAEMEAQERVEFVQGETVPAMEETFTHPSPAAHEPEEPAEIASPTKEEITEPETSESNTTEEIAEVNTAQESAEEAPEIKAETISEPAESPDSEKAPEAPAASQENELAFEPLHTIDYFASQGIVIKEEALMNDKLGKQVKSFTDWLKTMKQLHPGKLPEQNEVVEKIIQSSAELSNEDAGILTESMAEVLLKQGKKEKAIDMYQKLSLMNPSKSIYFAAKIERLKKS